MSLKLIASAGEGFIDGGRGFPLYGTGTTLAGELDVESMRDSSEAWGRAFLVGRSGLPGLPGAFCADGDLTLEWFANGRGNCGSDLPFAGLELGVGGLGVRNRENRKRAGRDETDQKMLHIAVKIITGAGVA